MLSAVMCGYANVYRLAQLTHVLPITHELVGGELAGWQTQPKESQWHAEYCVGFMQAVGCVAR